MKARPRAITPKERITTTPRERVLNKHKRILTPIANQISIKPQTLNPKERSLSPSR